MYLYLHVNIDTNVCGVFYSSMFCLCISGGSCLYIDTHYAHF